jgi:putative Holliday junction resolvase
MAISNRIMPTRIVGIDYGLARIGVAVSDERKILATPALTVFSEKKSERTIEKLLKELAIHQKEYQYDIEEIVIGLPLLMSGKQGLQADEVKHFAALLGEASKVPIVLWDERLTTVMAERSMREGNMTRKQRSKCIDKVAAVIILQGYLDRKQIASGGVGSF